MRRFVLICSVMMAFTLAFVTSARATPASFDITVPNTALSAYTGPYASVDINLTDSTHATITFTSYTDGSGNTFYLGGAQMADVNVNASSWTISPFTTSTFPTSDGGSTNVSDFGVFNQTLDNFDGPTYAVTSLIFYLENTGGTWASASDVLTPNSDGYSAAIHGFVEDSSGNVLVTGFGADGAPVPEPASLLLLGTGLLGWGAIRRRGKKRDA